MKNKAPLALMEQLIMLLVFALAAALCLQVFVYAGNTSRRMEARDQAVTMVQNAAEVTKLCGGDLQKAAQMAGGTANPDRWELTYDEAWQQTSQEAVYRIVTEREHTDNALLGRGTVTALDDAGEVLFRVTVSWQEATDE